MPTLLTRATTWSSEKYDTLDLWCSRVKAMATSWRLPGSMRMFSMICVKGLVEADRGGTGVARVRRGGRDGGRQALDERERVVTRDEPVEEPPHAEVDHVEDHAGLLTLEGRVHVGVRLRGVIGARGPVLAVDGVASDGTRRRCLDVDGELQRADGGDREGLLAHGEVLDVVEDAEVRRGLEGHRRQAEDAVGHRASVLDAHLAEAVGVRPHRLVVRQNLRVVVRDGDLVRALRRRGQRQIRTRPDGIGTAPSATKRPG